MEELLKYLGFTTPLIYAAAAYAFFHWLDENASEEAKAALARTMRFKDYKNEHVASALVEVFDRIYIGKSALRFAVNRELVENTPLSNIRLPRPLFFRGSYALLRWETFFRSVLFTTVVSAIYLFETGITFSRLAWEDLSTFPLFLLFNVLTDYLSLFVIRPQLILSGTKPVDGLALGAVRGVVIVFTANTLRIVLLGPYSPEVSTVADLLFFAWPALAVFVWLPLLALGIVTARVLTPLSWIVGRTQWFLKEGKEHPLKAIGYVAAVVVFLCTAAGRAVFSP